MLCWSSREEIPQISSLSHSVVFLYFFALIAEEGQPGHLSASRCKRLSAAERNYPASEVRGGREKPPHA